jgi:hypothetical protein
MLTEGARLSTEDPPRKVENFEKGETEFLDTFIYSILSITIINATLKLSSSLR